MEEHRRSRAPEALKCAPTYNIHLQHDVVGAPRILATFHVRLHLPLLRLLIRWPVLICTPTALLTSRCNSDSRG